jgi:hypothetical protein
MSSAVLASIIITTTAMTMMRMDDDGDAEKGRINSRDVLGSGL